MSLIEGLQDWIRSNHPEANTSLTPPLRRDGVWALDVDRGDKHLAVEWSRATGFGITSVSHDNFGEGPDEIFDTIDQAQARIHQLLTSAEVTSPPTAVLLSRLRERRGLTQQELAARMGVRQSSISGMESRGDLQLSTLRRVVEALGGKIESFAVFPDARYRIEVRTQDAVEAAGPLGQPSEIGPAHVGRRPF